MGRDEIYIRSIAAPRTAQRVSTEGGISPRWAVNGRELFYLAADTMMSVQVTSGATLHAASARLSGK